MASRLNYNISSPMFNDLTLHIKTDSQLRCTKVASFRPKQKKAMYQFNCHVMERALKLESPQISHSLSRGILLQAFSLGVRK